MLIAYVLYFDFYQFKEQKTEKMQKILSHWIYYYGRCLTTFQRHITFRQQVELLI